MQISKHVGRGITSDIILMSLYSWLVCGEDDGVALFKDVHFPKSQNVLPVVVGRYKCGFGNIDTGNRATERTSPTTVNGQQPHTPPKRTSAATTSRSTAPETPTAAAATTTTVTKPSTPPDRTSVSTATQGYLPEKATAAAATTITKQTTTPDRTSVSSMTPQSHPPEKLAAVATTTTVTQWSTPPDRTSVSSITPQSQLPEKLAAVATSTVTAETRIQIVYTTQTGGNVTYSTKETTTSAGHVISKTLAYISFTIIIVEHILFQ